MKELHSQKCVSSASRDLLLYKKIGYGGREKTLPTCSRRRLMPWKRLFWPENMLLFKPCKNYPIKMSCYCGKTRKHQNCGAYSLEVFEIQHLFSAMVPNSLLFLKRAFASRVPSPLGSLWHCFNQRFLGCSVFEMASGFRDSNIFCNEVPVVVESGARHRCTRFFPCDMRNVDPGVRFYCKTHWTHLWSHMFAVRCEHPNFNHLNRPFPLTHPTPTVFRGQRSYIYFKISISARTREHRFLTSIVL